MDHELNKVQLPELDFVQLALGISDILIHIAEVGADNGHALDMELVCKLFNQVIRRKLRRLIIRRDLHILGDVEWLKSHPSLTNTNLCISVPDIREISSRKFERCSIYVTIKPDPALLKTMFGDANDFELLISSYHLGARFKNGVLTFSAKYRWLSLFIDTFDSRITKLSINIDDEIDTLIDVAKQRSIMPNVQTITVHDETTLDSLAKLCSLLPITKLICWNENFHANRLYPEFSRIKKFTTDRIGDWGNIEQLLIGLPTLKLISDDGDIYIPEKTQHVIVKLPEIDEYDGSMSFVTAAYKNVLARSSTKITYKYDRMKISNTEPYDVVVKKLEELRALITEAWHYMLDIEAEAYGEEYTIVS